MTSLLSLDRADIEGLVDFDLATQAIEEAFRATSAGQVNLPPVGHIEFPAVGADCHIKYGHVEGQEHFVIKVAAGFPRNTAQGLSPNNGLSLVLSARTGAVVAVLHDEAVMTDIRTGIGGAIASRALARKDAANVLVVGAGVQARYQIESHYKVLGGHLSFGVWGRSAASAQSVAKDMAPLCAVEVVEDLEAAARHADIIVTATGSFEPLVQTDWVKSGTHITAVGADAPGKQELATNLVAGADLLVADRVSQCVDHGEISHAAARGLIDEAAAVELGEVLTDPAKGRLDDAQITIADLTGIAAQDIAIANHVLMAREARNAD